MNSSDYTNATGSRSRFSPMLTLFVLLALVAAACGSSSTESTTESDSPLQPQEIEYGATLDEWAEATEAAGGTDNEPDSSSQPSTDPAYADLEWEDLIPEGFSSDEIWAAYDEQFAELEYGTPEEEALYQQVLTEFDPDVIDPELDGEKIRMNGFVAPLTYDGDIVTEFLLVPYFGACIHVPPPPSNQTVLVTVDKDNGFTTEEAWGAIWVEGTLSVEPATFEIGSSGYSITGVNSGVYEEGY